MLRGLPGKDTKTKSILAASRLFPRVDLRRTARSKVAHDGLTDALLIAEFGRRLRTGKILAEKLKRAAEVDNLKRGGRQ